jgi:thioredoxin reductase (NADPH)
MFDIIIIGAGPAGMSAAIYARRAKKSVLVIEALSYGGQIVNTLDIENYPAEAHISGYDLATKMYNQAKELGAEFIFEKAFEITNNKDYKEVRTNNNKYQGKSIIIATGAKNRHLGLDHEDEYIGKGISYCATCDGNFYKKKDVAVIGGGNTALEDALYLSNIANKVYLLHRRDTFRASEKEIELVKNNSNIEILYNTEVIEFIGDNHLEKIKILKNEEEVEELEISGIFIAVGQTPSNEVFRGLIDINDNGYIIAGENCHTNIEGIFVAGENREKKLRQIVTATSDGAIAATEAVKYLQNIK